MSGSSSGEELGTPYLVDLLSSGLRMPQGCRRVRALSVGLEREEGRDAKEEVEAMEFRWVWTGGFFEVESRRSGESGRDFQRLGGRGGELGQGC